MVAPARERGLKCADKVISYLNKRRSREGAWIEIARKLDADTQGTGRSREGAWIEMDSTAHITGFKVSLPRGSVD